SMELGKVSGDHGDVESGKNRLLGLAIEQETECGVKPTLWRIPPRNHSFVCLFAHRYMMTALATCFADHHFEFEWIAVADLVNLDHSGLRHYRFVCRAHLAAWTGARPCRGRLNLTGQVRSHRRSLAPCRQCQVVGLYPTRNLPVRGSNNCPLSPKKRTLNLCGGLRFWGKKQTLGPLSDIFVGGKGCPIGGTTPQNLPRR